MPQGSILGPLLFILYINDFSKASDLLFTILFADDTSVFIEGTSYNNIINDMNRELEKVDKWLKSNKLTVNIKKTQYMLFHHTRIKHKVHEDRVHISRNNLARVNNIKFLGVIIDSKLNWSDHITYIQNKISKSIGILTKIRGFLNKKSLRNLYYSFLYPCLTYCVEVWGNAHDTYLDPLIKLPKKCVRVITFSYYLEHTTPLFEQLDILSFKKLVVQRISLLMFKRHTGITPLPMT